MSDKEGELANETETGARGISIQYNKDGMNELVGWLALRMNFVSMRPTLGRLRLPGGFSLCSFLPKSKSRV